MLQRSIHRVAALLLGASCLGACASTPPVQAPIAFSHDRYEAAFQAAKDVLREYEFELDRVDARAGVITTRRRQWAGLATPWIPHATDADTAIEGLMHHELRACVVTFAEANSPSHPADSYDLRSAEGSLSATVDVTLYRIHRPNQRIGAPSIKLRSQAIDPILLEEGRGNQYITAQGADAPLAALLAAEISRRLDAPTVAAVSPAPEPADAR